MRMKVYLSILFCLVGLMSCLEENPNLVNPPSQKENVYIRFLNLSGDTKARNLNLNSVDFLSSEYGYCSKAVNPPSDSVIAAVTYSGILEFKFPRKVKFVRNTYTTFLSIPSPIGAERGISTDTLIYFSSSSGLPVNTVYSYLKFVNAFPDSTVKFSVIDGCPNGEALFTNQIYRSVSSQKQVRSGRTPVSIIKVSNAGTQTIGLYDLPLNNDMQYTIIISANQAGEIVVNLLDEHNGEVTALSQPGQVFEKIAFIRTINMSSEIINIRKAPDELITQDLNPFRIGNYDDVAACGSQNADSIMAEYSSFISTGNKLSLNVNEKYTYLVADYKTKRAGFSIIIPEAVVDFQYPDKALIRVVNLEEDLGNITLSIASHEDTSAAHYTSGETIASSLKYGKISNIYALQLGALGKNIPLTLFSTSSPAKLLLATHANIEPGKSYVIIIKKNQQGNLSIYVVNDEDQIAPMQDKAPGQFFQFVNFLTGSPSVSLSYSNILNNAVVGYSIGIASVANLGQNQLNISGNSVEFTSDQRNRNLIIASGEANAAEFISLVSWVPNPNDSTEYSIRRFVNAAKDVALLDVVLDKEGGEITAEGVEYKSASKYYADRKEQNYSLFFYDKNNNKLIYRLNEVKLIHGKVYSFILGGNATAGYSVNIVQEF